MDKLVNAPLLETDELPVYIEHWSREWREEFEERAAIMEFNGGMNRIEAETWAESIVRAFYRLSHNNL
jgi:hypothetical protein